MDKVIVFFSAGLSLLSNPALTAVMGALIGAYIVGRFYGGRPVRDGIVRGCDAVSYWTDRISSRLTKDPDDEFLMSPYQEGGLGFDRENRIHDVVSTNRRYG